MTRRSFTHSALPAPGRRAFLGRGAALGLGGVLPWLGCPLPAAAADYKALVCVFLNGGNDGLNTVLPADAARHAQYAAVRGALALPRASLLPLSGTDLGLHPALAPLLAAWQEGALAPVLNIGPLAGPLSKAQYRSALPGSAGVPPSLFSHAGQQLLWHCAGVDGMARAGWGGRAAEALATVNPVISANGNDRFGLSTARAQIVVPGPGEQFGAYLIQGDSLLWAPAALRRAAIDALYGPVQDSTVAGAVAQVTRDAFAISDRLGPTLLAKPGSQAGFAAIDNAFAPVIAGGSVRAGLAAQLYQTAKLIAAREVVQGSRQIFYVQLDGFDTHAGQIDSAGPLSGRHALLLADLASALAAFHAAMKALGLAGAVTSFTQSDFGRTFKPNGNRGTDHAWGNHHLVLGGAVRGGQAYGALPELVLGGADDVGVDAWELQGRWIPTLSVDQYAATLLAWFGASAAQQDSVLPNLANFGAARTLGFV